MNSSKVTAILSIETLINLSAYWTVFQFNLTVNPFLEKKGHKKRIPPPLFYSKKKKKSLSRPPSLFFFFLTATMNRTLIKNLLNIKPQGKKIIKQSLNSTSCQK